MLKISDSVNNCCYQLDESEISWTRKTFSHHSGGSDYFYISIKLKSERENIELTLSNAQLEALGWD